ncbi:MAG: hypothetical protein K2M42_10645 [Oscillospiraceae bacterium]|nr:hypothetical protein [Oscillospiraceae bacterium]
MSKLKGRRVWGAALLALLSILIAASLTCTMSIAPYYAGDEALAGYGGLYRFFIYCLRSFRADVGVSSCLALGAGALLYAVCRLRPNLRELVTSGVFGALFSFMQVLGRSYAENQNWNAVFGTRFVLFRAFVIFLGQGLLSACLALLAFRLVDRVGEQTLAPAPFSWKRLLTVAGLVALCWLPYYLLFFPGLNNPDTSMQIAWALHYPTDWLKYSPVRGENVYATNHHPYFTTLLFGLFAQFGLALGNISYGVAAYNLLQLFATALAMAGSWFYLRHLGLSEKATRAGLVFTALFPLFPLYAITMLKDSLFSLACLTLTVLLFELARTRGACLKQNRFCVLLFCNAWLVMFSKNQGVYFIVLIGLACLAYKGVRGRAAVSLLLPAALFQVVWTGILLPMWNVAPGGKQETLGLLFQQTARCVLTYPDDVSQEEEDAIRAILDYDRFGVLYDPMQSDNIKFTFNQDATDEEMSAYYKAWLQMLRRHPDAYVQALISNVYAGFYVQHETPLSYTHYDNREVMAYPELCVPLPARLERWETPIMLALRGVQHIPGMGLLFSIGFFPWVILFFFLDALRRKRYGLLLPLLPCILSIAVLLVSPVSGSYRYAMPLTYAIPFLLGGCLLLPAPKADDADPPVLGIGNADETPTLGTDGGADEPPTP